MPNQDAQDAEGFAATHLRPHFLRIVDRRIAWIIIVASLAGCGGPRPVATEPVKADDYYAPQTAPIAFEDRIYDPAIHTVQVWRNGLEGDVPIIEQGSADQLQFHFDDLSASGGILSYTVVHCDANWLPDDLVPITYLDGTQSDFVPPPRPSSGTRQRYDHYMLAFPNAMMRPRISGNFLLKVYRDTDPDQVLFTRRFLITEQRVSIEARVVASRDVEQRDRQQQLDLTIRHPGFPIPDPFGDLKVAVLQNMRWDDVRTGLQPRYTRAFELIYDFPPQALFDGGNEWRPLNASSVRYTPPGVQRILTDSALNELVLSPDIKRNISMYMDQPDLNGRQLVRTDDGPDPTTMADYVWADWFLPMPYPVNSGQVFVYGAFTGYRLTKENRCTWDGNGYRARTLVKQGYIDHLYAWLPDRNADGSTAPDLGLLEGSHFQTENDYLVLVYQRDHTLRTDRLIASRLVNSRR